MAADNHASFTRIGLAIVIGAIAISVALVMVGGIGDHSRDFYVETYYDDPVGGLSVGAPVNFRGVKIGDVRSINFVTADYDDVVEEDRQRIRIVMALERDKIEDDEYPIRKIVEDYVRSGMRATVSASGITGLARIELNIQANPQPAAKLAWKPEYPLIPPQPSLLDSFSKSATMVMNRFNRADFGAVWSNLQSIAESSASFVRTLDGMINEKRTAIDSVVGDIEACAADLRAVAAELKRNPSLLIRAADERPLPETRR